MTATAPRARAALNEGELTSLPQDRTLFCHSDGDMELILDPRPASHTHTHTHLHADSLFEAPIEKRRKGTNCPSFKKQHAVLHCTADFQSSVINFATLPLLWGWWAGFW